MKFRAWIGLMAVVFVLAACGGAAPATLTAVPAISTPYPDAATAYPLPTNPPPPVQAYPAGQSYPAAPAATIETGALYPDLTDGAEVTWLQATGLILNNEVTKVLQTHDKKVFLTLKDGRMLFTMEAEIDMIMQVIQQCGEPCSGIAVATE